MPGMKPKGEVDMDVLEELAAFLQQRGQSGDEGSEAPPGGLEVEIKPGGEHTMPDGSMMADSEMQGGGNACPTCGKPY